METYQAAYRDYQRGNFDLAIEGFRDFLATSPQSDLADNAAYWVGESLFSQKKYRDAIEQFGARHPAVDIEVGCLVLAVVIGGVVVPGAEAAIGPQHETASFTCHLGGASPGIGQAESEIDRGRDTGLCLQARRQANSGGGAVDAARCGGRRGIGGLGLAQQDFGKYLVLIRDQESGAADKALLLRFWVDFRVAHVIIGAAFRAARAERAHHAWAAFHAGCLAKTDAPARRGCIGAVGSGAKAIARVIQRGKLRGSQIHVTRKTVARHLWRQAIRQAVLLHELAI